jgi:integrase
MRKAEILGLRWREIRNGQIYLGSDRTKNGKPREIPVSDTLANELLRLKTAQGGERITMLTNLAFSAPRERKRRTNGILQVVDGPMRDIRVAWETAKKKAGIAHGFHFHDLRHTFASHKKMAGTDDYTIMAINSLSLPEWNSQEIGQKLVRNSGSEKNAVCAIASQVVGIIGA